MKTYRCALIDFDKKGNNKIIFIKYVKGLQNARKIYNIPVHYSYNAKCFSGWQGNKNFVISAL